MSVPLYGFHSRTVRSRLPERQYVPACTLSSIQLCLSFSSHGSSTGWKVHFMTSPNSYRSRLKLLASLQSPQLPRTILVPRTMVFRFIKLPVTLGSPIEKQVATVRFPNICLSTKSHRSSAVLYKDQHHLSVTKNHARLQSPSLRFLV